MTGLRSLLSPDPPREEIRDFLLPDGSIVPVRWVRDRLALRLRLIVGERGVRLTLPRRASLRLAQAFLVEHQDWLARELARRPVVESKPFIPGVEATLPLRGEAWPVFWSEGRYARVEREPTGIVVIRPAKGTDRQLQAALRDFYMHEARADLGLWLPRYLPGLPRAPSGFRFRPLSSLWGSLSPADALSLDLSLVLGRPSAFEYVLVHELCHLFHRDHSRRFWREVEARSPEWRLERDYLHGEGLALKRELGRLLG